MKTTNPKLRVTICIDKETLDEVKKIRHRLGGSLSAAIVAILRKQIYEPKEPTDVVGA
jgi:hypothetical protein